MLFPGGLRRAIIGQSHGFANVVAAIAAAGGRICAIVRFG
jgi:hypothetical protein